MKSTEYEIDEAITDYFANTLSAMNISDHDIKSVMYDMGLPALDFAEREQLSGDGIEITPDFADENIEMAEPQQFMKYKKRFIVLYIKDQFLKYGRYMYGNYNPFHVCWCNALKQAKAENRYDSRYVMTYNSSGSFKVNLSIRDYDKYGAPYTTKKEENVYKKLSVCQQCLYQLNWKNFRKYCGDGINWPKGKDSQKRFELAREFDIQEYMRYAKEQELFDHPVSGTASSSIMKKYVLTPQIKSDIKRSNGCICDGCGKVFKENKLEIHHKNHNEGDNRRENLLVLCSDCHDKVHAIEGGLRKKKESNETTDHEYVSAVNNLADMYENGRGVTEDKAKAEELRTRVEDISAKEKADSKADTKITMCRVRADIGDESAYYDLAKALDVIETDDEGEEAETKRYEARQLYKKAVTYYEKVVENYELNQSPEKLLLKAKNGDEGARNRLEKLADSGNVDAMLAMAEVFM